MNKMTAINFYRNNQLNLPCDGAVCNPQSNAASTFQDILSLVISVMTAIAFIWFTIQFFIAAISWIGAGGDKGKVESARSKMITSVIGLVIVISAIFLIRLIGAILGIPILNIASLIRDISP